MLGGNQARADAQTADERWNCARIVHRADLDKQTTRLFKSLNLTASQVSADDDNGVTEKQVKPESEWEFGNGRHLPQTRAIACCHVHLWRKCANGDKPLLIVEDGLLMPQKLHVICAHLTATVERVCDVANKDSSNPVLLALGGAADPLSSFKEQWLPTDMQQPGGQKVVLREASELIGSFAYIIWPRTARRLLASLPIASPIDSFLSRMLQQETLRALNVQPPIIAPRLEPYVPAMRYQVVYKRVAVRSTPKANGFVEGGRTQGDVLEGLGLSEDQNWLKIRSNGQDGWLMIEHPEYGKLLERIANEDSEESGAVQVS